MGRAGEAGEHLTIKLGVFVHVIDSRDIAGAHHVAGNAGVHRHTAQNAVSEVCHQLLSVVVHHKDRAAVRARQQLRTLCHVLHQSVVVEGRVRERVHQLQHFVGSLLFELRVLVQLRVLQNARSVGPESLQKKWGVLVLVLVLQISGADAEAGAEDKAEA